MATLTLFEKLNQIEARYDELAAQLASAEVLKDSARFQKFARAHAELGAIVGKYREWKEIEKGLRDTKELLAAAEERPVKASLIVLSA